MRGLPQSSPLSGSLRSGSLGTKLIGTFFGAVSGANSFPLFLFDFLSFTLVRLLVWSFTK